MLKYEQKLLIVSFKEEITEVPAGCSTATQLYLITIAIIPGNFFLVLIINLNIVTVNAKQSAHSAIVSLLSTFQRLS